MVKVLFVDDSSTIMEEYLSNSLVYGVDAVCAWDGAEALDVLARESIDVVVSDMNMPKMNGIELLQAMKDRYRSIPFLMASTLIIDSLKSELDRLGASGYFIKPVNFDQLMEKIRGLLAY